MIGWGCQKAAPKKAEEFTFPVASGIIAGGSLMGVVLIFWENGPQIVEQLVSQIAGPLRQILGL